MALWRSSLRAKLVYFVLLGVLACLVLVVHNGVIQWKAACRDAEARAMHVASSACHQHGVMVELTRRMLVAFADDVKKHVDPVACNSVMNGWSKLSPVLFCTDLGLADRDGRVVCRLGRVPDPVRTISQNCVHQAIASGRLSMGLLSTEGAFRRGTIDFVCPVPSEAGTTKLLAFASLDATWFDDMTWRLSLPRGATITMIDSVGTVLARNLDPDTWLGHAAPDAEIVKTVLRARKGTTEATGIDGVRRIYGFAPLDDHPGAGYVYAGIPKDVIVSEVKHTLLRNLGWLGMAGLFGMVAVHLFAYRPMRTIGTLLSTTRRIAAGDLTARTGLPRSPCELGQLATFFDQMADALQSRDMERRAAEQRVREEKDLSSTLIESLPGGFFLIDEEYRITLWNEHLSVFSGYGGQEISGMSSLDLVASEDRDVARQILKDIFRTGEGSSEIRMQTKQGDRIPCWFSGMRTTLKNNPCVVGLSLDISELKRVETALIETERTLRTILDTVPVGISLCTNRAIRWANPAWMRILGFQEAEECVGKNARMFYADRDEYERTGKALYQGLENGRVTETDTFMKRKDGTLVAVNVRMKRVYTDEEVSGTEIAVVSDISERMRAEKALRESERHFRELVECTDLCSVMADAQGAIVFCNDSMLRLTGWERSEVLGQDLFTFFCAPDSAEELGRRYREAVLQGNTPLHTQLRIRTRSGEERVTKWTTTLLRNESGMIFGSASIGEDITQQKKAEDALRVSKETLEGVFHAITESIILCDDQARIIMANETAAQRLGRTVDDLIDTCVYDAFPSDVAEQSRAYGREVIRTSRHVTVQDRRGDLFLDISLYPIFGPDGRIARVAAFGRDMTHQRLAEQALIMEKQKFQNLCELAPFGMVMIAGDGTFLYINQRFRKTFGYDLDEVPNGRAWMNVAFPDPAYRAQAILAWKEDLYQSKASAERERVFTVRCKDGTDRIARFIPELLDSGEHLMTVQDITAQRQSEERLRESEERFRAIFQSATDCIFLKDRAGKYTHVNPAMERLFGLPGEKLLRMTDEALFGHEVAARIRKVDHRVIKGNSVEEEQTRVVNSTPITLSIVKAPLYDSEGRIVGLCGIARDITDRKQAGEEKLPRIRPDDRHEASRYCSPAMKAAMTMAQFAAATDSTVLLLGESGSGKDHVGHFIHEHSLRAGGPYFVINCASVSPDLADSELFGHEAGAFTGAFKRKLGLLELAEGGTLLLNEVGELPLPLQAKLLTFLDTSQFARVGGERTVSVNTRILAATNRDLEHEVSQGHFRSDLYYRLNVFALTVPPLRDRTDDLPVLVQEILSWLAVRLQLHGVPSVGPGVMEALASYHWPGNVRELRNVLERAIILSQGDTITVRSIPLQFSADTWCLKLDFPKDRSLNHITDEVRKSFLIEALRRSEGNKTRAARLLGISRHSVINYVKEFGITVEEIHTF